MQQQANVLHATRCLDDPTRTCMPHLGPAAHLLFHGGAGVEHAHNGAHAFSAANGGQACGKGHQSINHTAVRQLPYRVHVCSPQVRVKYPNPCSVQYSKHTKHPPATPPPMTSTLAGGTRPAAVIWPVKKRPKWAAASTTALQAWGAGKSFNRRAAQGKA